MKGIEIGELRKIHESAQHLISDTGILHFTTKEAAQKDRKGFEKELVRLKKVNKELDDRNKALGAEKDKQCEVIEAECEFTTSRQHLSERAHLRSLSSDCDEARACS